MGGDEFASSDADKPVGKPLEENALGSGSPSVPAQPSPNRLGHTDGETFTVPGYSGRGKERQQQGEHTFTVSGNDGRSATVTSEKGGSYTMHRDAVKHFADDLNQRVDVPEHPSHPGINQIREGKAQFLGKGDDGLVFNTGDGRVTKVTTSVPYNLSYFRKHNDAIADARRQVDLTNQAIAEGHDFLLPQSFEEHGEKGFTTMPRVELGGPLSREQITQFQKDMQQFHDAGWHLDDEIQHGVDSDGRIRVFDTGKLEKRDLDKLQELRDTSDDDSWGQQTIGSKLLTEHGHYNSQKNGKLLKFAMDAVKRKHKDDPWVWEKPAMVLQEMIENKDEALPFVVDDVRDWLQELQADNADSEMIGHIEQFLAEYESKEANQLLDERMLNSQQRFSDAIDEYEQYDDDDPPNGESLDSWIHDRDMFGEYVVDLSPEQIASLALAAYQEGKSGWPDYVIAGFGVDEDALVGNDEHSINVRAAAQQQEARGLNLQGDPLEPGQEMSDGGRYEPLESPDMDEYMRNQYPEGSTWLESGFLMSDGTLLDMSYGSGQRVDDHRSISPSEEAAKRWNYPQDMSDGYTRWALLKETLRRAGAFRIDGEAGFLHMETDPTGSQERAIAQYIAENEPPTLAITFGDDEWYMSYPSVGSVMRAIDSVANGEGVPGEPGELRESDLVDLDAWLENEDNEKIEYDEIDFYHDDQDHHYITAEGYHVPAMHDLDTEYVAKLAAMNPGLHLYGNEATFLGMPSEQQLDAIRTAVDDRVMETLDIELYDANGNSVLTEQLEAKEGDKYLDGQEVADAIEEYFNLVPMDQSRRTENLKRWNQGNKIVNESGEPIPLYHGTARPDKIVGKFSKSEATSGPMQYFTDSPELGSKYSQNKPYNQANREDDYEWSSAFTIGGETLNNAWRQMTPMQKQDFAEKLPLVEYDEDKNKYVLGDGSDSVISADHLDWVAKQDNAQTSGKHTVGDYITAAYNLYVMGGITYPDDDQFRQVLEAAGIPRNQIKYDDPQGAYPGVFKVFIRMRNPLVANNVPPELADAIDAQAAIEQESFDETSNFTDGVDPWDKRSKDPKTWADLFRQATTHTKYKDDNSFIWTSIPDWATEVFRKAGYDGLIDRSNKSGTQEETNNVYVPFDEHQIKSAIGNSGNFAEKTGLRYAAYDEPISEESMPQLTSTGVEPKVDAKNPVDFASEQGSTEGLQRPTTAIEPDHLEHYVHEVPGPIEQPEPDQAARDQLFEISKATLPDDHPEGDLLAPEAKTNMARNLSTRLRGWQGKSKSREQEQERAELIRQVKELQRQAFPKRVAQPTGWEDDDHYYHVTAASNTESIEEGGLQIGQPPNFQGGLRHNIKGNVFLTEKSGVQSWQEMIGNQIAEKTELYREQLESRQRNLQEQFERSTQDDSEFFDENVIQEIEEIEAELGEIAKHEADSENWTKTFRVPKSLLQDFVTTDPIGTEDANAQAYKLNNEIVQKVRTARAQMANVSKVKNEALVLLKELDQEQQEQDAQNSNAIRRYHEANEELAILGKNIGDNPANVEGMSAGYERREVLRKMWAGNQSLEFYEFYMQDMIGGEKWVKQFKKVSELREASDRISRQVSNQKMHNEEARKQAYIDVANSDILQMQLTVASQPNYWRWAKNNKAVDENGLPIIIYHGTQEGGYSAFEQFDYGEHIYGSPNVNIARTYNGGFTDDVTPIRATSLDDIKASLQNSDYVLSTDQDFEENGVSKYQVVNGDGMVEFEGDTEEELLAEWNKESDKSSLKLAGVYPLVFRLQDPLIVEGNNRYWSEIPMVDENWHVEVMEGNVPEEIQNQIDQKLHDYQIDATDTFWNTAGKDHKIDQILNLHGEDAETPQQMLQDYATIRIAHLMPMDRSLADQPRSYQKPPLDFMPTDEIHQMIKKGSPGIRWREAWNDFIAQGDEELGIKPIVSEFDWRDVRQSREGLEKISQLHDKFVTEWNDAMEARLTVPVETELDDLEDSFSDYANKVATLIGVSTRNLLLDAFSIQEEMSTREYAAWAERQGHDGIIFKDILDDGGRGPTAPFGDVYVCFKAEQAKSAHNTSQWKEMGRDRENLLK